MEGQQKETQYPGWHKDATGKGLWSGENNGVPEGDGEVWGNSWRDQQSKGSVL